MRALILAAPVVLLLTACGGHPKPSPTLSVTVCAPVTGPPKQALKEFQFREIPNNPKDSKLVAGLTAEDQSAILYNLARLKAREAGWQVRAQASGECTNKAATIAQ